MKLNFSGESNSIGYGATMRDEHSKIATKFTRFRHKRVFKGKRGRKRGWKQEQQERWEGDDWMGGSYSMCVDGG